ncbi:conserved hypothetical protein [Curtobacterium sp. 8I-2]|nr:conserved hypothetical protein [Curtobacterium sp. 8I-2]
MRSSRSSPSEFTERHRQHRVDTRTGAIRSALSETGRDNASLPGITC